jgi:hypothetical protein
MTETIAAILDLAGKLTVVGILALDLVVLAVGLQRQCMCLDGSTAKRSRTRSLGAISPGATLASRTARSTWLRRLCPQWSVVKGFRRLLPLFDRRKKPRQDDELKRHQAELESRERRLESLTVELRVRKRE